MQRIQTDNGLFHGGDPSRGIPGTIVTAKWLNDVQEELVNVITSVGITLGDDQGQLLAAINRLIANAVGNSTALQIVQNIPTSNIGDAVKVLSMLRDFYWRTVGAFNGYVSAELGHYILSPSAQAVPGAVLADGRNLSKSDYRALFEFAKANGLVKPSSQWVAGSYWFVDLVDSFKIPDLRSVFFRALGGDPDNANAMMPLGGYRYDRMQNATGTIRLRAYSLMEDGTGILSWTHMDGVRYNSVSLGGSSNVYEMTLDLSRQVRTGAKTEPENVALNCYIYTH